MKGLRNRFERFCFKHHDKGIPNLMLFIVIGSAIVYLIDMFSNGGLLYYWLAFDKASILEGQVWRLFTFLFTYAPGSNPLFVLIGFYCFYHLGRHVELSMGTFRFNLFYFSGAIIMVIFAMIFSPMGIVQIGDAYYDGNEIGAVVYSGMAWYLHLTLLLTFAVFNPDAQFIVFFIIPVKAWFLGIVYLVLTLYDVYTLAFLFPHNLFPLVGLANFLLFAGKDVLNLLPERLRPNPRQTEWNRKKASKTIPFTPGKKAEAATPYTHRCAVCGRTDVSNPDLEFRYCSRCKGYHCYCEDHISNHTHIEE